MKIHHRQMETIMPRKKSESFNFETATAELTEIVAKMEQGELSLEDSLQLFERGVTLTRQCQQALKDAEQKVQILTEKDGQTSLADFSEED